MTDVSPHPDPETLSGHADGMLDELDAAMVTGHVEACAQCRVFLQSVSEVGTVLGAGVEVDPLRRQRAIRAALAAFDSDAPAGMKRRSATTSGAGRGARPLRFVRRGQRVSMVRDRAALTALKCRPTAVGYDTRGALPTTPHGLDRGTELASR